MRHYKIISVLILLSSQTATGTLLTKSDSTSVQKISKNSITLSTGVLPFQYGKTMLNYERVLCQSVSRKNVGLGIITGIGKFSTPKYDGVVINPALVFFAGGEKRYFDLSAGINIFL